MITSLTVENYRSLRELELSLGQLVVLIGPNGSGKSNLLNVLRFAQQVVEGGELSTVFADRGGYGEVVWGGKLDSDISLGLQWQSGSSKSAGVHTYSVQFAHQASREAVFSKEEATAPEGFSFIRSDETNYSIRLSGQTTSTGSANRRYSVIGSLSSGALPSPSIVEPIREFAFYRFDPQMMRQPQPVGKRYRLVESGGNLSAVIHTLFSEGNPALDEIVDFLKACVPTVEHLRSPITDDGRTYVALKEESVPSAVGSWGLSDGTLFALALATALFSPLPPSLLAIEAPDTELHPHVMETLAEMLVLASQKTQVIVTTHSPYLLDFLPPESFVVVEKSEGATHCKALKGRKGVKQMVKDLGVGEAWYAGHLGGVP